MEDYRKTAAKATALIFSAILAVTCITTSFPAINAPGKSDEKKAEIIIEKKTETMAANAVKSLRQDDAVFSSPNNTLVEEEEIAWDIPTASNSLAEAAQEALDSMGNYDKLSMALAGLSPRMETTIDDILIAWEGTNAAVSSNTSWDFSQDSSEQEETVNENTEYPSTEGPLTKSTVEELMASMNTPEFESLVAIGELYFGMDEVDVSTLLHLVQFETAHEGQYGVHDYYYQYLGACCIINAYRANLYPHHYASTMIAYFGGADTRYRNSSVVDLIMSQPIYVSTCKYTLLALTHLQPYAWDCHGLTPENGYYSGYQKLSEALYASEVWPGWGIWSASAGWY